MTSDNTRRYWVDVLRGWAEARLMPPQYDECCAVLDELLTPTTEEKECHCANPSYPLGACSNCGGVCPD